MSRVQLALNVPDIDEAVDFYSKLFATEPQQAQARLRELRDRRPAAEARALRERRAPRAASTTSASRSSRPTRSPRTRPASPTTASRPSRRTARVASPSRTRCGSTAPTARGRSTRCSRTATTSASRRRTSTTRRRLVVLRVGARGRRRAAAEPCDATPRVPDDRRRVWRAADCRRPGEWTHRAHRRRARRDRRRDAARRRARDERSTTSRVDDFPLPTLAARVVEWSRRSSQGRGFVLLRRFPDRRARPPTRSSSRTSGSGSISAHRSARTRTGRCSVTSATKASTRTDPERAPLPHPRAAGLPHRRRRHRRPAVPAARRARRREPDRERGYAVYNEILRRRPDLRRRALRADVLGPQRRAVAKARIRSSRCPSSATSTAHRASSTSAGTSATRNATRRCRG